MSPDDKISKVYDPSLVEKEWYEHWLDRGYFHAEVNSDRSPYTVVIPPPNVTGSLTIGHVLNNTIQDILLLNHSLVIIHLRTSILLQTSNNLWRRIKLQIQKKIKS